ncbi:Vps62-related protein [uncultured Xanthomonas sp.]|uniref:Vps62-related protein n=1 Tax=uncultured Xanthomonas sp. TaxID=152831 RepID=UPI0025D68DDD|nr:Vps62-related protein [uncultured Xanthomonas sp.]
MSFLCQAVCNSFDLANQITDRGSGAGMNISFWHPLVGGIGQGEAYFYTGLYATNNYANPPSPFGPMVVLQEYDSNQNICLSAPLGFTTVWECNGSGRPCKLGIYSLQAPAGYIALGSIAVADFNTPPTLVDYPGLMCVREEFCQLVSLTKENLIWDDRDSGADSHVLVWQLPYSGACFAHSCEPSQGYPTTIQTFDIILLP